MADYAWSNGFNRKLAVASPRSEAWRIQTLSGTEAVLQIRDVTDPAQQRFDEAYRRIGELNMVEVESFAAGARNKVLCRAEVAPMSAAASTEHETNGFNRLKMQGSRGQWSSWQLHKSSSSS
jgi:hypothetical protein